MKLERIPFQVVDWGKAASTEHAGESGRALWRTVQEGNVRVRFVEYSAGYLANHWCEHGHVLLVLEGEIVTELRDGRQFVLRAGDCYIVADGPEGAHRSRSPVGARLFIAD
jgi:mannose-6-phosphate isomerase-like protein (cupin superfamily)